VERANQTHQDRLVKELRLAGISTIESANVFAHGFMEDFNARSAQAPFGARDLHRPLMPHDDSDEAFAWKELRTVTCNLTLHYDKVMFILEPNEIARPLARRHVAVIDYPNGRLAIRHKGVDLPYRTFDRLQKVDRAAIVENKRLGEVLAFVVERQRERTETRSVKALRRRGQAERPMFNLN